ncbi:hypothetical protein DAPPUDRAFT_263294 [Daphnia pulex]|uniref:Uncharacterized protein n=1 Tax=Daphnia pulex TaxID=6669 RepID=E9HPH2_DAPPU|nr:hypothetical protein DAPPUDRAFT_263294 [Daphnia pulex]|eukprot:EFX66363.1 hypothetical protein DAPPUDRAFT_263294 [Daphnia pulex]
MSTPKKMKYAPAVAENEALVTAVTIKLRKVLNFRAKLRMYTDYDRQHHFTEDWIQGSKEEIEEEEIVKRFEYSKWLEEAATRKQLVELTGRLANLEEKEKDMLDFH